MGDRFLHALPFMIDNNYLANHYIKNCDTMDTLLRNGRAYFPEDVKYKEDIESAWAPNKKTNTTCDTLAVACKQDKKKFVGMDVSGVCAVLSPQFLSIFRTC
jgi:hypothetical protein